MKKSYSSGRFLEINLFNNSKVRLNNKRVLRDCARIAEKLKGKGRFVFNLVLEDNKQLRAMKKKYYNLDVNTDVISFGYSLSELGGVKHFEGDIFISAEQVKDQAPFFGNSFYDELAYVIIHGILHTLGYDDTVEKERFRMFKKQDAVYKSLFCGVK